MAFARLLLHQPSLAFLDEATGALDTTTESILYNSLRGQSTSYVSIGRLSTDEYFASLEGAPLACLLAVLVPHILLSSCQQIYGDCQAQDRIGRSRFGPFYCVYDIFFGLSQDR